jgi:hypothetical protein
VCTECSRAQRLAEGFESASGTPAPEAGVELGPKDVELAVKQPADVRNLLLGLTRQAQPATKLVVRGHVQTIDERRIEDPV